MKNFEDDEHRANRGASWGHAAGYCRASNRRGLTPFYRLNGLGFRVLRRRKS